MEKKNEIMVLNEENIENLIYEIRGQKVMLDFDLAKIYGYTAKAFNQQVYRNANRFDDDFSFQLTSSEWHRVLRSQNVTAKSLSSRRRYFPYAFTEQGIYMLMTVLKGDLAVRQSKATSIIKVEDPHSFHRIIDPLL